MDNYQKFGQISGQVFIGIGFGIGCAILSIIIADQYYGRLELLGIGLYGLVGLYIGHPIGIGYDGFKLLKKLGRQKYFLRFFIQSVLGALLGVAILYYGSMTFRQIKFLPEPVTRILVNLLMMTMPLAGATIGFNFRLPYTKREQT